MYNENDPEFIGLVAAEPEIEKYAKYSMLKKWLDKPIPELKRISKILSNDAIINRNKGLKEAEFNDVDGKTVYDYKITKGIYQFKIYKMYEYTQEMEESYERNVEQNSTTIISNESQGQRIESDSNVLLPNNRKSQENDSISRTKYTEWFDKKRNKRNGNKNSREKLDSVQHSISDKDSNGRTLTKQQREYFKDSKVVDDNGNLKEVYHGSNTDFNVFKNSTNKYSEYARRLSYTNDSEHNVLKTFDPDKIDTFSMDEVKNEIKETRDKISKIDEQIKEFEKTQT